jgi:hypothetical protein
LPDLSKEVSVAATDRCSFHRFAFNDPLDCHLNPPGPRLGTLGFSDPVDLLPLAGGREGGDQKHDQGPNFGEDPRLKDVMQKAGVTSAPDIKYIQVLRMNEVASNPHLGDDVSVTHKVKDFNINSVDEVNAAMADPARQKLMQEDNVLGTPDVFFGRDQ